MSETQITIIAGVVFVVIILRYGRAIVRVLSALVRGRRGGIDQVHIEPLATPPPLSPQTVWQMSHEEQERILNQHGWHTAMTMDGQIVWLRQYEYLERDDIQSSAVI